MHFLLSQNKSNQQIQNKIPTTYRNTLQTKTKTKTKNTVTMFQIKNSIFISFFLIATAISATNASGGKCWGQNNSCPDTLVNFAEMNGKTLCCSPNGGCGGATYTEGDGDDSTSNVQDCSEAVVESILSIEDTTSSGSASIFALTASSIVAPFAVMLMN